MRGLVYILTNPVLPGLVKIGITTQKLEQRLKSLSNTNIPEKFKCYYCREVKDCNAVEKKLHYIFDISFADEEKKLCKVRPNPKKEFFRVDPARVKAALELFPGKDGKFGRVSGGSIKGSRRSHFTFPMVGIRKGSKLTFLMDETKTATVIDDKKIKFGRSNVTLSGITLKLLKKHYGYKGTSVRGTDYWLFHGETLTDIRGRMEGVKS